MVKKAVSLMGYEVPKTYFTPGLRGYLIGRQKDKFYVLIYTMRTSRRNDSNEHSTLIKLTNGYRGASSDAVGGRGR
jgi:hypothetical protein